MNLTCQSVEANYKRDDSHLTFLPMELLLVIISFLPCIQSLCSLSQVHSVFRALFQDPFTWRYLTESHYGYHSIEDYNDQRRLVTLVGLNQSGRGQLSKRTTMKELYRVLSRNVIPFSHFNAYWFNQDNIFIYDRNALSRFIDVDFMNSIRMNQVMTLKHVFWLQIAYQDWRLLPGSYVPIWRIFIYHVRFIADFVVETMQGELLSSCAVDASQYLVQSSEIFNPRIQGQWLNVQCPRFTIKESTRIRLEVRNVENSFKVGVIFDYVWLNRVD